MRQSFFAHQIEKEAQWHTDWAELPPDERLKFASQKVAFFHLKDMTRISELKNRVSRSYHRASREFDCARAERVGQALSPANLPDVGQAPCPSLVGQALSPANVPEPAPEPAPESPAPSTTPATPATPAPTNIREIAPRITDQAAPIVQTPCPAEDPHPNPSPLPPADPAASKSGGRAYTKLEPGNQNGNPGQRS